MHLAGHIHVQQKPEQRWAIELGDGLGSPTSLNVISPIKKAPMGDPAGSGFEGLVS